MWNWFVDAIRVAIFAAAHVCNGSLGGGVLAVSFAVRLALLPLTLRLARRARHQQRRLTALRPQLERLQTRFASDPARMLRETQALHQRHGIRLIDPRSLLGTVAQLPLLAGLFAAVRSGLGAGVRFLWIADLARPDRALVLIVAGIAGTAASLAPAPTTQQAATTVAAVIAAIATIGFLWSGSGAIALSWGAGSVVSGLQSWLLRREELAATQAV
jgi:YidC/Oxa1 family membrane protein insertase